MKRFSMNLKASSSRYALSYTMFFAFLLLVMGMFMYARFSDIARQQYEEKGQEKVLAVAQAHRVQWDSMRNTVDQLMASAEYTPFTLKNDPIAAMKLINRLGEFCAISEYYDRLFFSFGIDDYMYTNTTSVSLERALTKGLLFETLSPEEAEELLMRGREYRVLPMQQVKGILVDDGQYLGYVFPLVSRKNAVALFLVSRGKLERHLNADGGNLLWLYAGDGSCLYGAGAIPASVVDELREKHQPQLSYGGVDYMCFSYTDEKPGITYYLLQPVSELTRAMQTGTRTVLLFAFMLTIPALLIIAFSSIRFGHKIHRIRQIVAPLEEVDSLENIESAAKKLASRSSLLDSVLDENVLMKRNKLIRRLVQDGAEEPDKLAEEGRSVGLNLSGSVFAVLLVGLRHDRREDLLQTLNRKMGSRVWGIELILYKQALFLMCEPSPEALEKDTRALEAAIRSTQSTSVISVSACHTDGAKIPLAFLEAQSAFDMRFLMGTDALLRFDESVAVSSLDYPTKYIDALKNAIRIRNREKAQHALTELIRYAEGKKMSMPGFRLMYNDVIHVLLSECSERAFQENATQMYSVFSLSQCLSIAELNQILSDLCLKLIDRESSEINASDQMSRIAEYIQTNYADPNLSMGGIAQEHKISAVAFSIGFKEAMGMSPSDYLTMTRMEQAKERLIQTDATVREIGLAVGYNDTPGFLRKFKAYTAMTPTQYRIEMRAKAGGRGDSSV